MLTVLIRYKETRREVLMPAKRVEFVPESSKEESPGLLINHGDEAESGCFLAMTSEGDSDWRDVFVMNAQGQTVARYIL
jgi:hypothetical protein